MNFILEGRIVKALSGFYYIESEGKVYQTRARGNFRKRKITPLVGDQTIFESTSITDGYLLEILPRTNQLVRPAVANVDQGVIVSSLVEPNFSYNLLDRFLVTLEYEAIHPIIYLTKKDLLEKTEMILEIKEIYFRFRFFLSPHIIYRKQNKTQIDIVNDYLFE